MSADTLHCLDDQGVDWYVLMVFVQELEGESQEDKRFLIAVDNTPS